QHHGLPTRLLDLTSSSLAALWFAVRNPAEKKDDGKKLENGVVWVLSAVVDDFRLNTKHTGPCDNKFKFVPLEKNRNYKNKLAKLIIPPSAFSSIRSELNMMNANAALLFPD